MILVLGSNALDLLRCKQLSAELASLGDRSPRKVPGRSGQRESRDKFSIRALWPAWPPGASRSTRAVRKPSDAP